MTVAERNRSAPSESLADDQNSTPVPVGFIRVGSLAEIPTLLAQRGHDANMVAARLAVDARLFQDPDAVIPIVEFSRIIHGCADLAGCSHLGLLLGQQVSFSLFGVPGQLARQARDVGSALRDIIHYLHMHGSGVIARLEIEADTAIFTHACYNPDFECADQIADRAMAGVCNMMRSMCGIEWAADEICLPHRRPKDVAPYNNHFRAPVRFDQEQAALVFSAQWLQQPVPGADAELHRLMADHLEKIDASAEPNILDLLRRAMHSLVVDRKCSADSVAQLFSIHRRTMSRRLKQRETQFHLLLEETKFEVARQLVRDTNIPLVQIAAVLNYSEAGAFSRAFKRWSGINPAQWREQNRRGNDRTH